jgi:hypothetical protein
VFKAIGARIRKITKLEWLVIVAIVAILIALMIPGGKWGGSGGFDLLLSCAEPLADDVRMEVYWDWSDLWAIPGEGHRPWIFKAPGTSVQKIRISYDIGGDMDWLGRLRQRHTHQHDHLVVIFAKEKEGTPLEIAEVQIPIRPKQRPYPLKINVPETVRYKP